MNGFWGADTEALRTMGTVCSRRAEALADLETLLTSTIDNIEWIGEDADRFRADWSGIVRPSLQDQEVALRQHARRLVQHADEQEEASAPDGPMGGAGGGAGWSSPGEFLRDVVGMAEGVLRDLLDGGPGGQRGPFAELLREVLSTPEGRAAFLGSFLGTLLGGLLADMITRAIGTGMALENLLTGLGLGGGLSNLIGSPASSRRRTRPRRGSRRPRAADPPLLVDPRLLARVKLPVAPVAPVIPGVAPVVVPGEAPVAVRAPVEALRRVRRPERRIPLSPTPLRTPGRWASRDSRTARRRARARARPGASWPRASKSRAPCWSG